MHSNQPVLEKNMNVLYSYLTFVMTVITRIKKTKKYTDDSGDYDYDDEDNGYG